ncbi:leukemia inhibitory factor receptor-like [Seriola lalandi dorsalis]|uniref:Leptin receptor n=1 Tax=Seriola lalandi dorsalis TaxID=1841481 RepID=A0A3B4Y0Q0_SERLL|nr:leukemia inhibitory factor receptor-like [Seriola lalandi dorsalis]
MITWLLLISLFSKSTQDGSGQETGVLQCGPQNLTLTGSNQMMLVTWEDDPSCSAVKDLLIYELLVLVTDEQVHRDEVSVTPDQIGSTHSWNWTSYLALECVSHSVRLSLRYRNQTGPWRQEQTLPGNEKSTQLEIYPKDRVFEVGSRVTFCCVLPAGYIFDGMNLIGYSSANNNITQISNWIYALTLHLNLPSEHSCTDVKCRANISRGRTTENGACAFIGYPPGDKDLQCETQDLESVRCHWTVGRHTHLPTKPTEYKLLGRKCADGSPGSCSQKVQVNVGERNWTLMAHNELGTVELSDRADLTKRVHMFAPEGVTASTVNARTVSLEWGWKLPQYNNLNITCQVNVSHGSTNTMSESCGVGLNSAVLTDLIPHWQYNVKVRCGTTQHFWKWSNWSTRFNFHTKGDVPDALDVWMQMKDNEITVIWKVPLANQSHGHIRDYEVTWAKTTETEPQNRTTVAHTKHNLSISIDTAEEYLVTVTARNMNGSSSPSTITTPPFNPDTNRVSTSRIAGVNGSFSLSWSASPTASCGYVVDWCPTSGHSSVEWLKVPPHETNAIISSEQFKDGLRYSLSIYACTQGAPVLLERREGYIREKKIQADLFKRLKWKQQDSNVEVSWDPVPLTEQTAFIEGYILYWREDNNNNNNNKIFFNVSTDSPEAISLTARNLMISSYRFTVKALTALGECGTKEFPASLNSQTDNLIKEVIISLVTVFSLLCLITVVCYRHWVCIKQKVYPPIPRPLFTDKWLTSPVEHICRPLHVEECYHSEADIMDIQELLCKPGALVNGYVSNENTLFIFSPTSNGYYNQPLKNCTPAPLCLPTTTVPSQSALPSSPFRSVFPNPSYDLIMQTGDRQCDSEPGVQEETHLERNSGGYQPQGHTETITPNQKEEDPVNLMSCVSTYILLPQSTFK